tara:strand:- start:354 stop:1016 length:663 start_codon:yes stop_codon:yes gene_type:complete
MSENKNLENEHYFKEKTEIPLSLGLLSGLIKGVQLEFYTSPPVFSWRNFDKGTLVLAENMEIKETDKTLLDLGCGYGVLGICAAYFNPNLQVTMIDKSNRAVLLSLKNVQKYNLKKRAKVLQGDLYEALKQPSIQPQTSNLRPQTFDVIVCNPPYSAGKVVVNKIIEQAPGHLNRGGNLQIIGRKSKGGEMYKQKMIDVFGNCDEFGINSGYRVYRSVKK